MEPAGILQKKIQLLSEYGIPIGEAHPAPPGKTGTLLFYGEKFYSRWEEETLLLYDRNKALLLTAKVPFDSGDSQQERTAFVLVLAWTEMEKVKRHEEALLPA